MFIRFFREADFEPVSALLNQVHANPTRTAWMTPERLRNEADHLALFKLLVEKAKVFACQDESCS